MSDDKSDETDFMNRWSRKKAEARTATVAEEEAIATPADAIAPPEQEIVALDPEAQAGGDGEADTDVDPEEIPPEIADIDIEALNYDSDFTVFMKDNVPEIIRRRALRQLWRSNPILANVDGLNDYDEDYTDAALVVKGLKSAYKIGKGYLTAEDEDEEGKDKEGKDKEDGKAVETAEAEATPDQPAEAGALDEDAEQADTEDHAEFGEGSDAEDGDNAESPSDMTVDATVDDPVKEV